MVKNQERGVIDLYRVEMIRVPLLETGETHTLAFRFIGPSGSVLQGCTTAGIVTCTPSQVLQAKGLTLTALEPGEAEVKVDFGDNRFPSVCWRITVIPPSEPIHRITAQSPRILFLKEEAEAFRRRIRGKEDTAEDAPETAEVLVIQYARLWHSYVERAAGYLNETGFTVHYPSISQEWHVSLPLEEPEPTPDPQGYTDFPYWTMYARAIEERLIVLSTVYIVTGKVDYAEKARGYLLALASYGKWYEFDHRGAEGNLSNAHFLIGVSAAYDAIRDIITEGERLRIRDAILSKGLQPLAIDIGNRDRHNIVAAKHVAMMFGAAAIADEVPYAAKYLQASLDYLTGYLDFKLNSGETEGFLYDQVAARHVWMAADLYRRMTGNADLVNHPYLAEELPERLLHFLSPVVNTFPNFSDSFYKLDIAYVMAMTASHHAHPAAGWYMRRYEAEHPAALLYLKEETLSINPEAYYQGAVSAVFQPVGWAALRSGWGRGDHLLCFTSSPSAKDHNHRDQNQIMLNVGGEWLLTGPGYQDYVPGPRADYTIGTIGHNSLLVNGQGQQSLGGGHICDSSLFPSFEVVSGDASASYGESLRSYRRTLYHIDASYYVIVDDAELNREGDEAELLFHTTSSIYGHDHALLGPGESVKKPSLIIRGEEASVRLFFLAPGSLGITVQEYPGAESYGPFISVKAASGSSIRFVTLLIPQCDDPRNITVDHVATSGISGIGFTVLEEGERRDFMMFCDTTETMDYEGYSFSGAAVRWSSSMMGQDPLDTGKPGRLDLSSATRFAGQGIRYRSDKPLSLYLETGSLRGAVYNGTTRASACELCLDSSGVRLDLIVPPGKHNLDLKQGWIIPAEERGETNGNARTQHGARKKTDRD
ncbi:heparinase II/III domain-containing protein [Paenibacillus ihbetae]|nr:heparinase II/III family protein [Paenibacillus ihbetae]